MTSDTPQPGFQQCLQWLEIMAHESGLSLEAAQALLERQFIVAEMERQEGNQCKVARELGIHRNTVRRILTRRNLDAGMIRFVAHINRKPPRSAA